MKKKVKIIIWSISLIALAIIFADESGVCQSSNNKLSSLYFIGSENCKRCHEDNYGNWKKTLHSKMMQRVEAEDSVLGDFETINISHPFQRKDVTWTLGSKWEQQYLSSFNGRDIILPGKWLVTLNKWKLHRYDGWGWENSNPQHKCHGCHTTGYRPETGRWVELSIGCEACHGPGSKHAVTKKAEDIISNIRADICGQCHARGKDVTGNYNFPIDYKLDDNLENHFKFSKPFEGANRRRFWWGNGFEKKRHQEYLGWKDSSHARSFDKIKEVKKLTRKVRTKTGLEWKVRDYDKKYGKFSQECLRCHSGEYFLANIEDKQPRLTQKYDNKLKYGITCAVCHDVCGGDGDRNRSLLRTIDRKNGNGKLICHDCHPKGAFYHREESIPHYPCLAEEITCVDCHMPLVGKNAGTYSIRSHSLRIIPPSDSIKYNMPNSCNSGACHQKDSLDWIKETYNSWYNYR